MSGNEKVSILPSNMRDPRIDLLRGLSILSVLLLHFQLSYNLIDSPLGVLLPRPYLVNLVWNGNYGVTVFFVISGYLITSTSIRRFGSLSKVLPRTFYIFRFARIFPCLLLVLPIVTLLALAHVAAFSDTGNTSIWLADVSILTFWHNVLMARAGYFNYCLNVFWSLSVEEAFYLAFPLICIVLRRPRWVALVWIAAVVAGPIYRSYHAHDEIRFLYGYLACFDAIAMGCLVAIAVTYTKLPRLKSYLRNWMQASSLAFMVWIFIRAGIDSVPVWGTSAMACGAALYLFAEALSDRAPTSECKLSAIDVCSSPVVWLGRHSYELYLFHIVLLAGMRTLLNPQGTPPAAKPALLLFFLAISSCSAWAVARFYSEPVNRSIRLRSLRAHRRSEKPA